MPHQYNALPDPMQWEKDVEKSKAPAAVRVKELLQEFYQLDRRVAVGRAEVVAEIWLQLRFLVKYAGKDADKAKDREKGLSKEKSGAKLSMSGWDAASALLQFCSDSLPGLLANGQPTPEAAYRVHFGRDVGAAEALHDQSLVARNAIVWMDAAERRKHKLSFRGGIANVKRQGPKGEELLAPYDTRAEGDAIEEGGTNLFVMDDKGRIYAYGKSEGKELKHSSFLQGGTALAAGTMRFARGKLELLTPASGHYRPTMRQMLVCLERLVSYQVNLDAVSLCRINRTAEYMDNWRALKLPGRGLEPFNAAETLKLGHFKHRYGMAISIRADGNPD